MNNRSQLTKGLNSGNILNWAAIQLLPEGTYSFTVIEDANFCRLDTINSDKEKFDGKQVVSLIGTLANKEGEIIANELSCVDRKVLTHVNVGSKFIVTITHVTEEKNEDGDVIPLKYPKQRTNWQNATVLEAKEKIDG